MGLGTDADSTSPDQSSTVNVEMLCERTMAMHQFDVRVCGLGERDKYQNGNFRMTDDEFAWNNIFRRFCVPAPSSVCIRTRRIGAVEMECDYSEGDGANGNAKTRNGKSQLRSINDGPDVRCTAADAMRHVVPIHQHRKDRENKAADTDDSHSRLWMLPSLVCTPESITIRRRVEVTKSEGGSAAVNGQSVFIDSDIRILCSFHRQQINRNLSADKN